MIRLYFQQALYHLRENPIITWVSVLGTALAICMIMVLVITFQVRLIDCEPEVNRSRSLYVSAMSVKNKGAGDNDSSNARMSVRTGRECFKNLTTAEAVTLISLPEKVRASLPAGNKATVDMVQTDDTFWHIFHFRFLSGKAFTKADCVELDGGTPPVRNDGCSGKDSAAESCGIPYIRRSGRCVCACHFCLCTGVDTL